jgi:hypothetical protein
MIGRAKWGIERDCCGGRFGDLTGFCITCYNLDANGDHAGQETVAIAVEPIRDGLFLVTWTESDKTTVVHLEDYRLNRIITNITDPVSGLSKFEGSMTQIG